MASHSNATFSKITKTRHAWAPEGTTLDRKATKRAQQEARQAARVAAYTEKHGAAEGR